MICILNSLHKCVQVITFACLPELACPRGHTLAMMDAEHEWTCDECQSQKKRIKNRLRCARCDHDICKSCQKKMEERLCDIIESPTLPSTEMRREIGNIPASLWAAIEDGATESYAMQAKGLSLADRILVKTLHVEKNAPAPAPGRHREAMKIVYEDGENAAKQILANLSGRDVARKVQWSLEVEVKSAQTSAACNVAGCSRSTYNGQVGEQCCRTCKESNGARHGPECEKRTLAALPASDGRGFALLGVADRHPAMPAAHTGAGSIDLLRVDELKKELRRLGLDSKGRKAVLVQRLRDASVEKVDTGRPKQDEDTMVEDDGARDEIQTMIDAGITGLADLEIQDCNPFRLTRSGTLQPDPLALRKMEELASWYAACGRLVGCALWTGKVTPLPMARFFCRRVLEMVRSERLVAYSADGEGPPFFNLVGTRIKIISDDFDRSACPEPFLRSGSGSGRGSFRVLEACTRQGKLFVKCEVVGDNVAQSLPGWISASSTTAEITSEAECHASWAAMKRLHQLRPFNGTFCLSSASPSSICGQGVRVSKLSPVPVFKSDNDKAKDDKAQSLEDLARDKEAEDEANARRIQEAQDEAYARAMQQDLTETECDRLAQVAVQKMFAIIEAEKKKAAVSASCRNSPLLTSQNLQTLILGSNVTSCKMDGFAFLPAWAMHALGVQDGQEISIEPLQLPLNEAGRAMHCSATGTWFCNRKMEHGKCAPGRSICADCKTITTPDLTCGLGEAFRVNWRMPNIALFGELERILGSQMQVGDFMEKHNLSYIKASREITHARPLVCIWLVATCPAIALHSRELTWSVSTDVLECENRHGKQAGMSIPIRWCGSDIFIRWTLIFLAFCFA